jgi:hypothetical protein
MSKQMADGGSAFFKNFKTAYYNFEFHKPVIYVGAFIAFLFLASVPFYLANNAASLNEVIKQGSLNWRPPAKSDMSDLTYKQFFVAVSICYLLVAFLALIFLSKWSIKTMYSSLNTTRAKPIRLVLLATIFTYFVHIFACAYLALVDWDATSLDYAGRTLQTEGLDVLSAYYFSLTTIATVGFGDIHPSSSSSLAKVIVMLEILIGLGYAVFVFSVLANFIRGSPHE